MAAPTAAAVLRDALDPHASVTVADAAARGGLALRDAERGLQALTSEYRGQLRVTNDGDLVYRFPFGFKKPWETRDAVDRALAATGRAFVAAMRFVARAWIAVVLVGYTAIFVALMVAMLFAQRGGGNNSRRGGSIAYVFFRIVGDALYWTFRPFSPVYFGSTDAWGSGGSRSARRRDPAEPKVPFYERVNRFLFGPVVPPEDPLATERLITSAIRAGKGRIGLADVMRVTGLKREQADPMMARLMLDYDGDVDVSEEGGIVYRFPALRKTAGSTAEKEPPPFWLGGREPKLPPMTGNSFGANLAVAALNAFNLAMGIIAIESGMTLERAATLFERIPHPVLDSGIPIVLGVVPVVFSLLLFAIPLARALRRPLQDHRVTLERGRLAVMRTVLERIRAKEPIRDDDMAKAWRVATESEADPKSLTRDLTTMGGDIEIEPSGATRWRFVDLETEAAAVEAEREAAAEGEAKLGRVVFSTEDR